MSGAYDAWEERTISKPFCNRTVHYYLKRYGGNSLLAAVGTEQSQGRMVYEVSDDFLEAFGSNSTINPNTKWTAKRELVKWLISLVYKNESPPKLSNLPLIHEEKGSGSGIQKEEKLPQEDPLMRVPKKLRSRLVLQRQESQDVNVSDAINVVSPKERAPTKPATPNLNTDRPRNEPTGIKIVLELPAQKPPVQESRYVDVSDATNVVSPKERAPTKPATPNLNTDRPRNEPTGIKIVLALPAQEPPVQKSRYVDVSDAINVVSPNEIAPTKPATPNLNIDRSKNEPTGIKIVKPNSIENPCFEVDDYVEILIQDSGMNGCWSRAKVVKIFKRCYKVQYIDVDHVRRCGKLEEWVSIRQAAPDKLNMRHSGRSTIRPFPPEQEDSSSYMFEVGTPIDAWWCDCWWEGVVVTAASLDSCGNYNVFLIGERKFMTVLRKDMRVSRDWIDNAWAAVKPQDLISVMSLSYHKTVE